MSVDSSESFFRFSEGFDSLFLNDLYGGDLAAAAEVFGSSAARIVETMARARALLEAGEREQLRRAVHHIKPLFGYTGLPGLQETAERFETSCLEETDGEVLAADFLRLEQAVREAFVRIASEHARLSAHVKQMG